MNLAQLPLPNIGKSKRRGYSIDMSGQKRMRPKSNLNNISGCGFRSIWDLCYPPPQARFCVCLHVFVKGGGSGIECAGPQTMCVPQGVVGGRLEGAQSVLLPCIKVSQPTTTPPPPEIKVITRPDEQQSKHWHPVAHTHPCEHMAARERGDTAPGVTNGIAVCLQALRIHDLVTKWHMIVLHAL